MSFSYIPVAVRHRPIVRKLFVKLYILNCAGTNLVTYYYLLCISCLQPPVVTSIIVTIIFDSDTVTKISLGMIAGLDNFTQIFFSRRMEELILFVTVCRTIFRKCRKVNFLSKWMTTFFL